MYNNIKMIQEIKLGDIWMCDLGIPNKNDISNKNVQAGKRPCLISSNNDNNLYAPTINLIPLTKQLHKIYPMHKIIGTNCGLKVPSYILPEQATTKNKSVLLFKIGHCDEVTMKKVQEGILIQQGMEGILKNALIIKKNKIFDRNRVFKMIAAIEQIEKTIKHESRLNILSLLKENLEFKKHALNTYCEDCGVDVTNYYSNSTNKIKKYKVC